MQAGNERFVRGEARFPTVQKEILADLAKGQQPYATILGCSDSRVPPELVFDAGFGELFIVRVAGNVVSPEVWERCSTPPCTCARRSSWFSDTKAVERSKLHSPRNSGGFGIEVGLSDCSQTSHLA